MRILARVRTNKVGSGCEDEFYVDNATPAHEIEECAREAAFQMVDWSYEVIE